MNKILHERIEKLITQARRKSKEMSINFRCLVPKQDVQVIL